MPPPRTPPTDMLPFLPGEADNIKNKLQMPLEMDRQVEAVWKSAKLKDDDRKLAADRVISAWEAKMRSYSNVRTDGTPDTGLSVNQVGQAFRRAHTDKTRSEGPAAIIFVKQSGTIKVTSTVQAFMQYFKA